MPIPFAGLAIPIIEHLPRTLRLPAGLTAIGLASWIASAIAMHGMGSVDWPRSMGSFLWLWIAMSAAMILPSLVPAASLATTVGSSGTACVGAYFAVWTLAGVVAFEAARGLMDGGRLLAIGAIVAAGLYQLTPLKDSCLRRCRNPLGSLLRGRAVRAGLEHGLVCLGCCWALMLSRIRPVAVALIGAAHSVTV